VRHHPEVKEKKVRHITGQVRSRRLGRSLGVDLVPFKTCPYDCIYCELGRTTYKSVTPEDYAPPKDILQEIRESLEAIPPPDHITLAGAGEPTLYSRIGEVIGGIKAMTDIPVALLTSGALFWMKDVRTSVRDADLIIPSLDGGDDPTFQCINRPHEDISFEKMIRGLSALRESYAGPLWLEVFLVEGMNTEKENTLKIRTCAERISPDRIQLNTLDRSAAEAFVRAVPEEKMKRIASLLGPRCEVIGG
jgi:wyosine [tRNA(Phe)-imidazoG37] synthetase (radical SAM superfamily)